MYLQPPKTTMAISNPTPPSEDWMYKEITEKRLVAAKIYNSYEYSRQQMAIIRKALNMKRIVAKTFAEFYKMDIYLFYPLKTMAD